MAFRTIATLCLAGLALAACASTPPAPGADIPSSETHVLEAVEAGPREPVASALVNAASPQLPEPQVDVSRIVHAGPPPDGIPAIDEPLFENAANVEWLDDNEPVVALSWGDEHRAYPIQIMMWHEIVNDTIDGQPVAVTYCPLCNSALAFDRQVDNRLLTFGTSGSLYLSALVMYDRQTESLWSQVERNALAGHLSGTQLDLIPVTMVRWGDWRAEHPDSWVLSRETGHDRRYGANPYVGYDDLTNNQTFLDQNEDERYPAKERIVTFPGAREAIAVLLTELADARVAHLTVDGEPVVLFSSPGLASSLEAADIADGRRVAATGSFVPRAQGAELTFQPPGSRQPDAVVAVDDQTGSSWSILGVAVAGPLEGERLAQVPHLDTFWFAQAAFRPDTEVVHVGGSRITETR